MKLEKLKETNIKKLKEFNWLEYFKYNNSHLLKLDFNNNTELSKEEIKNIDTKLFAILDLFDYYKQFERQLKDKDLYISKLKHQLTELKQIINSNSCEKLKKKISEKS